MYRRPAGLRLPLGPKDLTLALDAAWGRTIPLPISSFVGDHMIERPALPYEDADASVLGAVADRAAGLQPS